MSTVPEPHPQCPCGCTKEVRRVLDLFTVIVQQIRNETPQPAVTRAVALEQRMKAARITGVVR